MTMQYLPELMKPFSRKNGSGVSLSGHVAQVGGGRGTQKPHECGLIPHSAPVRAEIQMCFWAVQNVESRRYVLRLASNQHNIEGHFGLGVTNDGELVNNLLKLAHRFR